MNSIILYMRILFMFFFHRSISLLIFCLDPPTPHSSHQKFILFFFTLFVLYSLYHFMDHGFIFHHHHHRYCYRRMKMWCGWHFFFFFLAPHSFSSSYTKNTNVRINEYQFNWFGFFFCLFVGVTVRKQHNTTQYDLYTKEFYLFFCCHHWWKRKESKKQYTNFKMWKKNSHFLTYGTHTRRQLLLSSYVFQDCV